MNVIECEKLTRRFGRNVAIENLDLAVPAGSVFALLGPNGAGKSTTLKLLLNLLRPTSGRARVLGSDSSALAAGDFRRIGYVTEEQILPLWMTVAQLLAFCRPLYPQWDAELERRLLRLFDLPTDRKLQQLSRGMRMKAALLSSLAYRPELLVLDEPFSGLDPLARDDFIQGLLELPGDDRPRTIVISTHDIDDVERLADRVGFLADARLMLDESADTLRARFRSVQITLPEPQDRPLMEAIAQDWLAVRQPTNRVVQFVHAGFRERETEAGLAARFPGAVVELHRMSLREIFLALARSQRRTGEQEAA